MRLAAMRLVVLAGCGVNPAFDMTTSGVAGQSSTDTPPDPTTGPASSSSDTSTSDATTVGVEPASTSSSTTTSDASTSSTSDETTSGTTGGTTGETSEDESCPERDDLVACYLFPEDAGVVLVDDGPNQLHGDLLNTNPVTSLPGHGNGAEFILQSDVSVEYDPTFTTKYFTIAMFAFIKNGTLGAALVDKQNQYGLHVDNGKVQCSVESDMTTKSISMALPVETWVHISCMYDGDEIRLRVFGPGAEPGPVVSALAGDTLNPEPMSELRLGWDPPQVENKFTGKLDHVLIFSEALADDALCALASPLCP